MSVQFYPLTVSHIESLCSDAVAINFSVQPEHQHLFCFEQGQHLTLEAEIEGERVRRSYSISIAKGDPERCESLQVAVKQIAGGVFSTFANNQLQVGDTVNAMLPQGHFYTELDPSHKQHYALVAAGSGITPMLSIAETVLAQEPYSKVSLIFANKTSQSMMFKDRLSFLKNRYLQRFHWINLFSKEEQESELLNGRISGEKIHQMHEQHLLDLTSFDQGFICGPQQMVQSVEQAFLTAGLSPQQIHYELFYAGDDQPVVLSAADTLDQSLKTVVVKSGGRRLTLSLKRSGTDILESALSQGLDLPFSCKGGVCATCKAKVISGEVRMDRNHSLSQQEVESGMILTCQSHPVSDDVEIDFDV